MMKNIQQEEACSIPTESQLFDIAELFKVFGDSTRIRIIAVLRCKECNVGELALHLKMTSSAISHQLRVLRTAKLIKQRKSGKEIYYSLDDDHVESLFATALAHVCE